MRRDRRRRRRVARRAAGRRWLSSPESRSPRRPSPWRMSAAQPASPCAWWQRRLASRRPRRCTTTWRTRRLWWRSSLMRPSPSTRYHHPRDRGKKDLVATARWMRRDDAGASSGGSVAQRSQCLDPVDLSHDRALASVCGSRVGSSSLKRGPACGVVQLNRDDRIRPSRVAVRGHRAARRQGTVLVPKRPRGVQPRARRDERIRTGRPLDFGRGACPIGAWCSTCTRQGPACGEGTHHAPSGPRSPGCSAGYAANSSERLMSAVNLHGSRSIPPRDCVSCGRSTALRLLHHRSSFLGADLIVGRIRADGMLPAERKHHA